MHAAALLHAVPPAPSGTQGRLSPGLVPHGMLAATGMLQPHLSQDCCQHQHQQAAQPHRGCQRPQRMLQALSGRQVQDHTARGVQGVDDSIDGAAPLGPCSLVADVTKQGCTGDRKQEAGSAATMAQSEGLYCNLGSLRGLSSHSICCFQLAWCAQPQRRHHATTADPINSARTTHLRLARPRAGGRTVCLSRWSAQPGRMRRSAPAPSLQDASSRMAAATTAQEQQAAVCGAFSMHHMADLPCRMAWQLLRFGDSHQQFHATWWHGQAGSALESTGASLASGPRG